MEGSTQTALQFLVGIPKLPTMMVYKQERQKHDQSSLNRKNKIQSAFPKWMLCFLKEYECVRGLVLLLLVARWTLKGNCSSLNLSKWSLRIALSWLVWPTVGLSHSMNKNVVCLDVQLLLQCVFWKIITEILAS